MGDKGGERLAAVEDIQAELAACDPAGFAQNVPRRVVAVALGDRFPQGVLSQSVHEHRELRAKVGATQLNVAQVFPLETVVFTEGRDHGFPPGQASG